MTLAPDDIRIAATRLVNARRRAEGLDGFPGDLPQSLENAYGIQSAAISGWGDEIAGWKVGRLTGEWEERFGVNRFIGPIFTDTVGFARSDELTPFPAIRGGSAALEAEIIARLGKKVEPLRRDWGAEEARELVTDLHIGIEVAGCPVSAIGKLGPLASIAAFGNNLGLIVCPAIPGWREEPDDTFECMVSIDGTTVGMATTAALPGGLYAAIAFALNTAAELGATLPAGCWISTGAITGVHPIQIGQHADANFLAHGAIRCEVIPARAV